MRFKLVFLLLVITFSVHARQQEIFLKDLIENMEEDLPEDFDLSEFTEKLIFYQKHPINLNKAGTEELKDLFFLSPLQIHNLLTHISENGQLIDVNELQSIEGFDILTVQRLLPFVTLTAPNEIRKLILKNLFKQGENDLILRYSQNLEKQKGYTDLPGSRYLGAPQKALLRYSFKYAKLFSAALILDKDAGEKFSRSLRQPVDFISGHVALSGSGKIRKLVLGDYSLQFGQGLTLWTGFSFGKGLDVTSVTRKDTGLKPSSSANEYSFLRGMAATLNVARNVDFTPFVSLRKLDGSLSPGPGNEMVLSTINQTGLHRTAAELKNKGSLEQMVYGGALQYNSNRFTIGLVGYKSAYNHNFITRPALYDQFSFTGNELINLGLHYNYAFRNVYFFGEAAHSLKGGFAYVNGILVSLSSAVSIAVLHRDYAKDYHNFFNQAVAEATEAANEKGLYTGLNIRPDKCWAISVYADYFRFPWLKYRVDAPSDGMELLAQVAYSPANGFKATARYKSEIKQQNTSLSVPINFLETIKKDNCRFSLSWKLNNSLSFQHSGEIVKYQKGTADSEAGYLIYQDIDYTFKKTRLSGNIRLAWFNTPSYDSRIYAYENDVLYGFSFGMYNGKGYRGFLNLRYTPLKKLDLWVRYAAFIYPGNLTIGSGLDEITGNKKQELKLQLRYQF